MFHLLFERTHDAIWLFDPVEGVFVDCNEAAVALIRAANKLQLLRARPADFSPPTQPGGESSEEAARRITATVVAEGVHRFEWVARRLDGTDVPLEVTATEIKSGDRRLHVVVSRDVTERKVAEAALRESETRFRQLFERSADAFTIFDPKTGVFIDVNQASVELARAPQKEYLLRATPKDISPERQPDGTPSEEKARQMIALAMSTGSHRFEWMMKRCDGTLIPLEVVLTAVQTEERVLLLTVSRDISERLAAEDEIRRLNQGLEKRVHERTVELVLANNQLKNEINERKRAEALLKQGEESLRTLIESAPDAIVVLDADSALFTIVNENAAKLYGLPRERLLELGPIHVSPERQPDGRLSSEVAREKIQEAMNGQAPVFEWVHQHASGKLIPCEIRLVRLPSVDGNLVRGSIIDNSERRRREKVQQATWQISESIHAVEDLPSLYERVHGIIGDLMPARNFYIALRDPVTELVSFPYFADERDPAPAALKLTSGLTSYVLRTGKALLAGVHNIRRCPETGKAIVHDNGGEVMYEETGSTAAVWLGAPLSSQGRTFGVMAVQDYRSPDAYGEEEKQILTFMAEQTALAIERKRAEHALRWRSEQIVRHRNVLVELAQIDKANFTEALERICELDAATLNLERVSYWSLTEDNAALMCELLFLRSAKCEDTTYRRRRLSAKSCPNYFAAFAERKPIVAHQAQTHPATAELSEGYLQPLGITSMLDVPVWVRGRVVGVLCHEHVGQPREWTVEETDFAASLATMVSLSWEASERAKSEAALRESEKNFRALFETSSHGVMIHDEERFIDVNPAAVRIMGYENENEIIGKNPVILSPPTQPDGRNSAAMARKYMAECLEKGSCRFDWVARSANGSDIPIEVILTRVEMGGKWLMQAVINDITERKRAEEELHKALAHERELSQLKSRFISMVSHEFRTPLGIIMSSAEILRDYFELLESEERQHHLQSITKSTRRMSDLMEEVLVLGRLDAGKMDFKPMGMDLCGFFRRLLDEVLSATNRHCEVRLVPAGITSEAQADERLLRHIFTNLLTNAIKYSDAGQEVEFAVSQEGRDAICRICDQGIGIPDGDQERLFSAFHRGRNVDHRPGTGLGLVIVKRCVELHGGSIEIESRTGEGTTVTVRLPVF